MLRKDVIEGIAVDFKDRMILDLLDGKLEIRVTSSQVSNLRYIMSRLYTPSNTKTIIMLDDDCRMLITSTEFDHVTTQGYTGEVHISIMDPLFGSIFDKKYYVTKKDEELYASWLEKSNKK